MSRAAKASAALLVALASGASPRAHAQSKGDDTPEFMKHPVEATRRRGFTFGVMASPMVYWARGTPTEYVKRNDAYRVRLDHAFAPSVVGFLGVALADEIS